jgi:hypothetical protein
MSRRRQLVQIGQSRSSLHPQGGTLSPLLFVVFTADMPEAVRGAVLVLYADNTTGMVWADTKEEVYQKMEYMAEETLDYMDCNKLAPNAGKTQLMVPRAWQGRTQTNYVWRSTVQESSQVTFLGLELNRGLNRSDHVVKVEGEMATRTGILYRLRNFLPRKASASYPGLCV